MTANNTESNTVELTPLDFNNAAELLAAAFFDNPLHIYLFPNPANRFKAIRWMLRSNLNINLNSQKNMVGAPELRGTGIGTRLLTEQLKQVVEPSGFPAILVTQREANVRFYQRMGFIVASESIIGKGENTFVNWCLIRQS